MKNIAAIDSGAMPGFDKAAFTGSIMGKLTTAAKNGEVELVEKALDDIRDFDTKRGRDTFRDDHRIWKLSEYARAQRGDRSDFVAEPETVFAGDGVSIIANHPIDRAQIKFDAKPNDETRASLRSEGWNWSPTYTAWQRKLTDNAILSARRITRAGGFAQREEARREAGQGRAVA